MDPTHIILDQNTSANAQVKLSLVLMKFYTHRSLHE